MLNISAPDSKNTYDAILVGSGIMSSTLAVLLHELEPDLRLLIVERLTSPGLESSSAKNNAGTGHAANCELNYTPLQLDGTVNIQKALAINKAFEESNKRLKEKYNIGEKSPCEDRRYIKLLDELVSYKELFPISFAKLLNEFVP